jgi:hypothetical protein
MRKLNGTYRDLPACEAEGSGGMKKRFGIRLFEDGRSEASNIPGSQAAKEGSLVDGYHPPRHGHSSRVHGL